MHIYLNLSKKLVKASKKVRSWFKENDEGIKIKDWLENWGEVG